MISACNIIVVRGVRVSRTRVWIQKGEPVAVHLHFGVVAFGCESAAVLR